MAAYRAALEEWTRERVPLDWAMTQNNLGNALETLGERESGTARLEEAVAAYRAALEERTRERVPLDWAYSQHGLANALAALAKRQKRRRASGRGARIHARRRRRLSASRGGLLAADRPAPRCGDGGRAGRDEGSSEGDG